MPKEIENAIAAMAEAAGDSSRVLGFLEGAAYAMQVLKEQSNEQEAE